jgi:hypothetical protein
MISKEEVAMGAQVQGPVRPAGQGVLGAGVAQARCATATAAELLATDQANGSEVSS